MFFMLGFQHALQSKHDPSCLGALHTKPIGSLLEWTVEVWLAFLGGLPSMLVALMRMIRLSGMNVKSESNANNLQEIEIVFTGLRPGEKLYEELLISDKNTRRINNNILVASEDYIEYNKFLKIKNDAKEFTDKNQPRKIIEIIKNNIDGFDHNNIDY